MNSRRLTAFPKSAITPNLTSNSGYQNRKLRPAKWGAMVKCAAKILSRACLTWVIRYRFLPIK